MAERLKEKEDEGLEALFRSGTIEDNGFSNRVMARVRRGIWIRRWTLPTAVLLGGVVAAKPAGELLMAMAKALTVMPQDFRSLPLESLPQATVFILGGAAIGIFALFIKALEE
ncbi:MAG: hypothetical protein WD448_08080 [Woeseia sp.]